MDDEAKRLVEKSPPDAAEGFTVPGVIPIFPLPRTVLLPGEVLPLYIFEPRYREMVRDALGGHRVIGVVAIAPGFEEDQPGAPPVAHVGCAGLIIRHVELPEGRFLIWLLGVDKFAIREEMPSLTRYRQVRVALEPGVRSAGARRRPSEELRLDLLAALPLLAEGGAGKARPAIQLLSRADDDQLVAGVARLLNLPVARKQRLLEARGSWDRLKFLRREVDDRVRARPEPPVFEPHELN